MAQAADESHKDGSSWLTWMFVDGNELHRYCQPEGNAFCAAYITGVSDTIQMIVPNNSTVPCILRTKIPQLVDTVRIYLRDHPKERSKPGYQVVWTALLETWPPTEACEGRSTAEDR
jgi:Rap1a immunity proteins